jgi:hypothetical protein
MTKSSYPERENSETIMKANVFSEIARVLDLAQPRVMSSITSFPFSVFRDLVFFSALKTMKKECYWS